MSKETPVQALKRIYGSKDKLIDSVAKLVQGADEDLDEVKARLATASNAKLLRLAQVTDTVKEKYGDRDKMVTTLAGLMNRAKDNDFVEKLKTKSQGALLDMVRVAERRASRNKTA